MDMETQIKRQRSAGGTTSLQDLPEGCIASIMSLTTPVDVCRLSLVSKTFCYAAQSDVVWDHFLPSDLESIISEYSSLIATSPSKKDIYLALSDHPVIIDHGKKSFQLDKRNGKKCYMKAARDLNIWWSGTPQYWNWITMPESRFEEVAKLVEVCWFDIRGNMNTFSLSSDTQYAIFLVFKMINAQGFHHLPAELSLGITGGQVHTKQACLDPYLEERDLEYQILLELERPSVRSDGWLEIEIGEFFNSSLEVKEVDMSVRETTSNQWKRGFFLQGIEARPKL